MVRHPVLDALLSSVSDGVYCTDESGRITLWNRAAEAISGYPAAEVLGRRCCDSILVHVNESGDRLCHSIGCPMQRVFASETAAEMEAFLLHKTGHRVPVRIRAHPLPGPDGRPQGMVEVFTDLSHHQSARERIEELQRLALLDPLTQVGNRRFGEIHLEARLRELNRFGWTFGVLFADIDHFKRVNDRHGHLMGDEVLLIFAGLVRNALRDIDWVFRYGGEEFVALIKGVSPETIASILERIRVKVQDHPFPQIGQLTVSTGYTAIIDQQLPAYVFEEADKALYYAKEHGRNQVCDYRGLMSRGELAPERVLGGTVELFD